MSSCFLPNQQFFAHEHSTTRNAYDYDYLPTPQSALPIGPPYQFTDATIIADAFALLQQPANFCMSSEQFTAPNPNIRIQTSTPIPAAPPAYHTRQDSVYSSNTAAAHEWMYQPSMGGPAVSHTQGLKRARSHQRTPSASTVASNGPSSPYTQSWSNPQIANTDFAPNSPAHYADQAGLFSKNLPTPTQTPTDSGFVHGYIPSQAAHAGGAHQAMKGFAIDHHNGQDFAPEYEPSSRQSMSSYGGNDSPATPQSGVGETAQNGQYNVSSNGK